MPFSLGQTVEQSPRSLLPRSPLFGFRRRLNSGEALANALHDDITTLARSALTKPPPGTESLSFDLHESPQYIEYVTALGKARRKLKGIMRWVLVWVVGTFTGLVAVAIDLAVKNLFIMRLAAVQELAQRGYPVATQYFVYVGICLVFSSVAGYLVCFVEPLAGGSGIPEVKCYLNGVDLPRVVALRTLVAKAPGVMFSVAAGLPCGKEGPMIHSGAIIGSAVAHAGQGPLLQPYRSDTEVRDLVVAGASSGVAAAFGAPIGGVLFALEEGATHMNAIIMLRTFVCATAAALTIKFFLAPLEGTQSIHNSQTNGTVPVIPASWGELGAAAPLNFGNFPRTTYHVLELPLFAALGVFGGLCGALFNGANTKLTQWRMKYIGGRGCLRFLEVLVVTTTFASLAFLTPLVHHAEGASIANMDTFTSTERLFWRTGEDSIRELFHLDAGEFNPRLLCFFAVTYYGMACWTYGLGVPSGLFVPSLLAGAAFGRLFGQGLEDFGFQGAGPGIYALIGATAFLAGMARITISLAVILMEATGTTVFAIPIFLTVMVSKWTGDFFNHGLYDIHVGLKHIPLLEVCPEKEMIIRRARDVMNTDVMAIERVEKVKDLLKILESCSHNAFPVIHPESKRFVGMVKRSSLHEVLYHGVEFGVFQDMAEDLQSPPPLVPYSEVIRRFPHYPSLEEIQGVLAVDDYEKRVDLRPYTNRGTYTVPVYAALTRVYMLFRNMGLRHLPVVSHEGDVMGIITRKDLIIAHEKGFVPHDHQSMLETTIETGAPQFWDRRVVTQRRESVTQEQADVDWFVMPEAMEEARSSRDSDEFLNP